MFRLYFAVFSVRAAFFSIKKKIQNCDIVLDRLFIHISPHMTSRYIHDGNGDGDEKEDSSSGKQRGRGRERKLEQSRSWGRYEKGKGERRGRGRELTRISHMLLFKEKSECT